MLCLDPRLIIKVTAVLVCREMKEIDEPGRTGWGGGGGGLFGGGWSISSSRRNNSTLVAGSPEGPSIGLSLPA